MHAPHAADIAVIISSLIASLCFTFAEAFDDIFLFVKSGGAGSPSHNGVRQSSREWPWFTK